MKTIGHCRLLAEWSVETTGLGVVNPILAASAFVPAPADNSAEVDPHLQMSLDRKSTVYGGVAYMKPAWRGHEAPDVSAALASLLPNWREG